MYKFKIFLLSKLCPNFGFFVDLEKFHTKILTEIHAFYFISNTFISNARLKFATFEPRPKKSIANEKACKESRTEIVYY